MTTNRREFLTYAAALTGAIGIGAPFLEMARRRLEVPRAAAPLRILILGGTGFLGPQQVEYALARGHTVTLFNRGRTNPELFPNVEKLQGDRNDDLEALKGRTWDAVLDNSASIPRWVRQSAQLLKDAAGQYLFVSSISVYADFSQPGMTETAAVGTLDDPTVEQVTGDTYGPLKALCEQEAERAFPGRATIVRPGLIVGPGDRSDRFTYWPVRIDRGGEVLAPGDPTDPVQIVDVRDLGAWMVRLLEARVYGVYHATGPRAALSIAEMLYGIRAVTTADVSFTWVPADFLAEQKVRPWADMPVWVPPREGMQGFARVDCAKAIAAGLTFRPLAETARDTIDWFKTEPDEHRSRMRAGLAPGREAEVLTAWRSRGG
jgi:2'-hydroxyisoflavone reductase